MRIIVFEKLGILPPAANLPAFHGLSDLQQQLFAHLRHLQLEPERTADPGYAGILAAVQSQRQSVGLPADFGEAFVVQLSPASRRSGEHRLPRRAWKRTPTP